MFRSIREHDPYPPWQYPALISWTGIRGAVSLVAALALPSDFPQRDLIVFLTFAVILATLVLQGLTLPGLIRVLGVSDDGGAEREEAKARIRTAEAALARLEELLEEGSVHPQDRRAPTGLARIPARPLPGAVRRRRRRGIEERSAAYQRVMRQLLAAEHAALCRSATRA